MDSPSKDLDHLLNAWSAGDPQAANDLMELVYRELRRLAHHYLQGERADHTLQPTALVHELYLKLFSATPIPLKDRGHFLAVAATQLRRIIVDYARNQHAQKRGGARNQIPFEEVPPMFIAATDVRLLDLDRALGELEQLDARAARVVELRYFAGLTEKETAEALDIAPATVKRDWEFARSWLLIQLGG